MSQKKIGAFEDCLIGDCTRQIRFNIEHLILFLIRDIIESDKAYSRHMAKRLYDKLNDYFKRKTNTHIFQLYLENIDFEVAKIVMRDGIIIKKLSSKEKIEFLNTDSYFENRFGMGQMKWVEENNYVVKLEMEFDRINFGKNGGRQDGVEKYHEGIRQYSDLLIALMVICPLNVSHTRIIADCQIVPYRTEKTRIGEESIQKSHERHSLDNFEIDILKKLNKVIQHNNLEQAEKIAVSRLQMLNRRESIEDTYLDCFIGIEAIVMGGIWSNSSYQGEIRFRMPLTSACYLAEEPVERRRVFEFLKKAYDNRSTLVHGSKKKRSVDAKEVNELVVFYKALLSKWFLDKLQNNKAKGMDILFPESSNVSPGIVEKQN